MISKILIYVDDIAHIADYRKVGVSTFLFALEGYCVGYRTYSLEEIKNVDVSNKYILLNRVLDCKDIDGLKKLFAAFKGIQGIVFEDIGVYHLAKKMDLDLELILFQNHFATNACSVSFWLDRVDSLFISNEITEKEIAFILQEAKKDVCVHLFGHNQVMYSRRLLLKNWSEEFQIPYKDSNVIEDRATHVRFRAVENSYGTVMYSDKIYNGKSLLKYNHIRYFYVNPMLIAHDVVMRFLNDFDSFDEEIEDTGFLEQETIYKLKERD